jgi:hypothetical protein
VQLLLVIRDDPKFVPVADCLIQLIGFTGRATDCQLGAVVVGY